MSASMVAEALDLPGRWRKRLTVPPKRTALLLSEGAVRSLNPGVYGLSNWPAPAPQVILVDMGQLPFDLQIDAVRAGDGELVTLQAPLLVSVTDPVRLHQNWLRHNPGPRWALPLDEVAGRLHSVAESLTGDYAAADLNQPAVRDNIVRNLRAPLTAELARFGLEAASPAIPLSAQSAANQQAAAEAARGARELARDQRMQEVLEHLDSYDQFVDRISTWQEQTGHTLDEETIQAYWAHITQKGLEFPLPRQPEPILEARAAELETTAAAAPLPADRRLDQRLAREDASLPPPPVAPPDPINRLYWAVRLVTAVVGCGWAVYKLTSTGVDNMTLVEILREGIGLLLAVIGVSLAWITSAHKARQTAPYWSQVQTQMADSDAGANLAQAQARNERMRLAADTLIVIAISAALLLWLLTDTPIIYIVPVVLFLAVIAVVLLASRADRRLYRRADGLLLATYSGPSLPKRRTMDSLVRRQVQEYLKRVASNMADMIGRLYRGSRAGQEAATQLRRLQVGALCTLQEEARMVHYRDARYFASAVVPEAHLARMLDLDEDLLRRAQTLALDSEQMYAESVDGNVTNIMDAMAKLDKNINQLRRVLGERSAFISNT